MCIRAWKILGAISLLLLVNSFPARALMTVDVLSLTIPAYSLPDLNLPRILQPPEPALLPFYFQITFPGHNNTNWGIELYSDNRKMGFGVESTDGLYRGLRARLNVDDNIPLHWQVYSYDLNVARTWGTPNSVTTVASGLGFYPNTMHYWGMIYDRSDGDRVQIWDAKRPERVMVTAEGLGDFPTAGQPVPVPPLYVYIGADMRTVEGRPEQEYVGQLNLDFFHYPFDFNTGCYATPNPVKPIRGEQVYFNFYTNYPDSKIKIRIYDPTGYPVVTLEDTRFWNVRNSRHHFVEGGLYLYQIEVEGRVISGTVVVIK